MIEDLTLTPEAIPATVHRSRVYDSKPTPCDCWKCGRIPSEPKPPLLMDGTWIDCPGCGPVVVQELLVAEDDAYTLHRDVCDLLGEDRRKGVRTGGGGSGSRGMRHKPTHRLERRYEQEPMYFGLPNGREGGEIRSKPLNKATHRMDLIMSVTTQQAAQQECRLRECLESGPFPMAALVREAIDKKVMHLTETPERFDADTERWRFQIWLYDSQKDALELTAAAYSRSMGEVVDAAILALVGEELET